MSGGAGGGWGRLAGPGRGHWLVPVRQRPVRLESRVGQRQVVQGELVGVREGPVVELWWWVVEVRGVDDLAGGAGPGGAGAIADRRPSEVLEVVGAA